MMNRALIFALLTSLVLSACSREQTAQPASQSQSPTGRAVGEPSLAASAGTNRNLHVEVAGHDGKDHKDDAIAVARDILARLH